MTERFIHFSETRISEVNSVFQPSLERDRAWFKPTGLWFSVEGNDDGWKQWCEGEGFRLPSLAYQAEIVFADTAKILRICGADQIDAFSERWHVPCPIAGLELSRRFHYVMNWPEIAKQYDAIIIAPYVWERRFSDQCFWYYAWDCASGCVWNAEAVKELHQLPSELDRQAAQ